MEKFSNGSKWSCTTGTCKDCGKTDFVFIPLEDEGIKGYCIGCIKQHFEEKQEPVGQFTSSLKPGEKFIKPHPNSDLKF